MGRSWALRKHPKKAKLPDSLVSDFQKWIALGAPYDKPLLEKKGDQSTAMQVTPSDREFWSFKSLADPKPPVISHSQIKNDLDHFTFAKLAEKNLTPNPQASDSVRIRRAYLSVIGLPPSPQQLKDALSKKRREAVDFPGADSHSYCKKKLILTFCFVKNITFGNFVNMFIFSKKYFQCARADFFVTHVDLKSA